MKHKLVQIIDKYKADVLKNTIRECKREQDAIDMIVTMSEADPDQHQLKNTDWIIRTFLRKGYLWEDIRDGASSKVNNTLTNFLQYRNNLEIVDRDIMRYKKLADIAKTIRPLIPEYIDLSSNKKKGADNIRAREESLILREDDYMVIVPKTTFASCYWGRNTEWCTAATESDNAFQDYNKEGPLIIVITPDSKKYQFHFTCDPMDENDNEIGDIEDPVLANMARLTKSNKSIAPERWNQDDINFFIKNDDIDHIFEALDRVPKHLKTDEFFCELVISNKNVDYLHDIPIHILKDTDFIDKLLEAAKEDENYFCAIYDIPESCITLERFTKYGHLFWDRNWDCLPENLRTPENILGIIRTWIDEDLLNISDDYEIFDINHKSIFTVDSQLNKEASEYYIKNCPTDRFMSDKVVIDKNNIDLIQEFHPRIYDRISSEDLRSIITGSNKQDRSKSEISSDLLEKLSDKKLTKAKDVIKVLDEYRYVLDEDIFKSLSKEFFTPSVVNFIIKELEIDFINSIPREALNDSHIRSYYNLRRFSANIHINSVDEAVKFLEILGPKNLGVSKLAYYFEEYFENNKKKKKPEDIEGMLDFILDKSRSGKFSLERIISNNHLTGLLGSDIAEKKYTHEKVLEIIDRPELVASLPSYIINQYIPLEKRLKAEAGNWKNKDIIRDFNMF